MIRLIDNSYLHCIGACLAGKASDFLQIQTYLRFIGEVLTCEGLYFTADRKGPVYPNSEKVRQCIQRISNFPSIIQYYEVPTGDYDVICDTATSELSKEIDFIDFHLKHRMGVNPFFIDGKDPVDELHQLIMSNRLKNQKPLLKPVNSNFGPLVISKDAVLNRIKYEMAHGNWNRQQTQSIAIAARMLVYEQLAKKLRGTYLTSTARSQLHIMPSTSGKSDLLELSGHINTIERPVVFEELSDVVDALLISSEGDPLTLLSKAFDLRKDTETIRRNLAPKKYDGDAYFIKSKQLKRQYQQILDYFLKGEEPPSFFLSIVPQIVVPGIPIIKIDVERMARWFNYKLKRKHVKTLASLLINANTKRSKIIYDKLIFNCTRKKYRWLSKSFRRC